MPTVTLVLAGGPGFPAGSADHRYEIDVALDAAGRLDEAAWHADPDPWPLRYFAPGEPMRQGDVQHNAETGWSLRKEATDATPEQTEPLVHDGVIRPGEYLTLRAGDGRDYSWRIVNIEQAAAGAGPQ